LTGTPAYFLELRLRCRGDPEAMALVDRCLTLLAQAQEADTAELHHLEAEIETLRRKLAERLRARPGAVRH